MPEEEIPDKLPKIPLPACSYEWDANRLAEEYNSLDLGDPKRETIYREWKDAKSLAEWD